VQQTSLGNGSHLAGKSDRIESQSSLALCNPNITGIVMLDISGIGKRNDNDNRAEAVNRVATDDDNRACTGLF